MPVDTLAARVSTGIPYLFFGALIRVFANYATRCSILNG